MELKYISNDIRSEIIETAHAIHCSPELSHKDFETTELIKSALEKLKSALG